MLREPEVIEKALRCSRVVFDTDFPEVIVAMNLGVRSVFAQRQEVRAMRTNCRLSSQF